VKAAAAKEQAVSKCENQTVKMGLRAGPFYRGANTLSQFCQIVGKFYRERERRRKGGGDAGGGGREKEEHKIES
jgi:hypothetical protein